MFTLKIKTSNAAFHAPDPAYEIARILREVASQLDGGRLDDGGAVKLRDINGNTVGEARLTSR